MGGAGFVILLVISMVGLTIWSLVFLAYATHYFLTTLIDSGAGQDEIHYPSEFIGDLWWKPVFCAWILAFWVLIGSVLLGPFAPGEPQIVVALLAMVVWVVYPLSVLSALSGQNWLYFLHAPILWRLARQPAALLYVYLVTLVLSGVCVGLLAGMFGHNILWLIPAAFVLPAAMFLYARHWGRLVWLAFGDAQKRKKRRRVRETDRARAEPEVKVVADVPADGIVAGLPRAMPHAFAVTARPPAPARAVEEEEEDEWSTNKKPYSLLEPPPADVPENEPTYLAEATPEADKPIVLADYYDEQNREERKRQRKAAAAHSYLAPRSKRPTFQSALLGGVWEFMIYSRTVQAWFNLVILTVVELVLLSMVVRFSGVL